LKEEVSASSGISEQVTELNGQVETLSKSLKVSEAGAEKLKGALKFEIVKFRDGQEREEKLKAENAAANARLEALKEEVSASSGISEQVANLTERLTSSEAEAEKMRAAVAEKTAEAERLTGVTAALKQRLAQMAEEKQRDASEHEEELKRIQADQSNEASFVQNEIKSKSEENKRLSDKLKEIMVVEESSKKALQAVESALSQKENELVEVRVELEGMQKAKALADSKVGDTQKLNATLTTKSDDMDVENPSFAIESDVDSDDMDVEDASVTNESVVEGHHTSGPTPLGTVDVQIVDDCLSDEARKKRREEIFKVLTELDEGVEPALLTFLGNSPLGKKIMKMAGFKVMKLCTEENIRKLMGGEDLLVGAGSYGAQLGKTDRSVTALTIKRNISGKYVLIFVDVLQLSVDVVGDFNGGSLWTKPKYTNTPEFKRLMEANSRCIEEIAKLSDGNVFLLPLSPSTETCWKIYVDKIGIELDNVLRLPCLPVHPSGLNRGGTTRNFLKEEFCKLTRIISAQLKLLSEGGTLGSIEEALKIHDKEEEENKKAVEKLFDELGVPKSKRKESYKYQKKVVVVELWAFLDGVDENRKLSILQGKFWDAGLLQDFKDTVGAAKKISSRLSRAEIIEALSGKRISSEGQERNGLNTESLSEVMRAETVQFIVSKLLVTKQQSQTKALLALLASMAARKSSVPTKDVREAVEDLLALGEELKKLHISKDKRLVATLKKKKEKKKEEKKEEKEEKEKEKKKKKEKEKKKATPSKIIRWTKEEDAALMMGRTKHVANWKKIISENDVLKGRTPEAIKERYYRHLKE